MTPVAWMTSLAERFGEQWSRLTPPPPFMDSLGSIELDLATQILQRHEESLWRVKAARQALGFDAPADVRGRSPALSAAGELAEEMVMELRTRMRSIPHDRPLLSWVGKLDAQLGTDAQEFMDDPALDPKVRAQLIRVLDRYARLSGDYRLMNKLVRPLYPQTTLEPTVVLDLASGPGGFPVALAQLAGEERNLHIIATDIQGDYLEVGRRHAEQRGVQRRLAFEIFDALEGDLQQFGPPDIITCMRSLHHFGAAATTRLIARATRAARRGIVFVDISRSISRVAMAAWGAMTSLNPRFVYDSTVSVCKAFTVPEFKLMAACVPEGDQLEISYTPPAYVVLRTARGPLGRGA